MIPFPIKSKLTNLNLKIPEMPSATGTFSTSLRGRPEWAPAIPILLQKQHRDWKESNPETHDLAIPLPGPGPISNPPLLRFILLSPSDIPHPQTLPRLERLSHQDPTHRCAIILLLSGHDSMTALSNLQISLLTSSLSIPILPLTTPSELPSLLEDFYKKLVSIKPAHQCNPKLEAQQLLPYTALHPPLGSHPVNVLGDINSSLGDLVDKISTPQGRTILADYCPEVCGRVVGFWTGQG